MTDKRNMTAQERLDFEVESILNQAMKLGGEDVKQIARIYKELFDLAEEQGYKRALGL